MDIKLAAMAKEIEGQMLSEETLIKKALASKSLELAQSHPFRSNSVITYLLNGVFLEALEENSFELTERPDGIITLSDKLARQTGIDYLNYWNFRNREGEKDELALALGVSASLSQRQRGIVLFPNVLGGTCLSAEAISSQKRVFEVAVRVFPTTPPIIHEIVKGGGEIVVSWTEMGMGGIRPIEGIFDEFRGEDNDNMVKQLCRSGMSPFEPNPYSLITKDAFLPEPYQPLLFHIWTEQLKNFKNRIPV